MIQNEIQNVLQNNEMFVLSEERFGQHQHHLGMIWKLASKNTFLSILNLPPCYSFTGNWNAKKSAIYQAKDKRSYQIITFGEYLLHLEYFSYNKKIFIIDSALHCGTHSFQINNQWNGEANNFPFCSLIFDLSRKIIAQIMYCTNIHMSVPNRVHQKEITIGKSKCLLRVLDDLLSYSFPYRQAVACLIKRSLYAR